MSGSITLTANEVGTWLFWAVVSWVLIAVLTIIVTSAITARVVARRLRREAT